MPIPTDVETTINEWLHPPYDEDTIAAVKHLSDTDQETLFDAFNGTIAFGTGGMRGIMGVGTNRLNRYTIGNATQGLAQYILKQCSSPSVFISYDSRNHSALFAEETAQVLAGNGIRTFLTCSMHPTPFVSFGCRFYQCSAAVMITASHNPPIYNGYKVYWDDGAQVVYPHDQGIMKEVKNITQPDQVKRSSKKDSLISRVGEEVDHAYLSSMDDLQNYPKDNSSLGSTLHLIYSPLHGTGITTLPEALKRWGFSSLSLVNAQKAPDPLFSTVTSPNPEQKEALKLGIAQLNTEKGDLFFATDPDGDRIGVVVMHKNQAKILTGNQVAVICLYYLCNTLTQMGKMPNNAAFVTTIVTTELFKTITDFFRKPCFEVLTGFKYIGEKIHKWEQDPQGYHFIFGAEESLGYLYGTQVRDKDATISACLLAEAALQQKKQNQTLIDLLYEIYTQFGLFKEKQLSIPFTIKEAKKITTSMANLRAHPPKNIAGEDILCTQDFLIGKEKQHRSGEEKKIYLPTSDVLAFKLANGSKYVIRPSGTEPKIKLYGMVKRESFTSIETALDQCEEELDHQLQWIKQHYFS